MEKYSGNQKGFIYASCDAKNQMEVFEKYLEPLARDGISFCWGDSFDGREDGFIAKSNAVMLFLTKEYAREEKLRRTVEAAVKHDKPILSVYLEEVELDPGLSMQIESQQAMFVSRYKSDGEFIDDLKKAAIFDKIEVTEQQKKKQKRRVLIAVAATLAAVIALVIAIRPMLTPTTGDALGLGLSKEELASIEQLCIVGTDILEASKKEDVPEGEVPVLWVSYEETDGITDITHIRYDYSYNGQEKWDAQAEAGDISDISVIVEMKNLRVLALAGQQIEDITPILELENLNTLYLDCNPISSLDGLEKLKNLESLHINSTNIEELPEGLHVRELDASNTKLRKIPDFGGLEEVHFEEAAGGEPLSDVSNINTAASYETFKIHCDDLQSDQVIAGLKGIPVARLILYGIQDMDSLQDMADLNTEETKELELGAGMFSSLEGIEHFEGIEYLGLHSCEQLTDLSPVNKLQSLKKLQISSDMESMADVIDDRIEVEIID